MNTVDDLSNSEMHRRPGWERSLSVAVIILATLIGGGLRLHDLGGGGVWFDELYTVRDISPQGTGYSPTRWLGYQPTRIAMSLQGVSPDQIPGEQYGQYQDAGIDLFKPRIAACLIGILAIPLLGWAGWRPLGPVTAAMLAVLMAMCVWNIGWSQTARFYSQVGLLGGLAVLFYLDAITSGSRWRFAAAVSCVVLAFLSHPPAVTIGGAFVLDALVQLARRRPLNYGKWGWGSAIVGIGTCLAVLAFEHLNQERGYGAFVGDEAEIAQNPAMVVIYFFVMLTPVLALAAVLGLLIGRGDRKTWVLAFAAFVPVLAIAGISATGGFAHARYAYVGVVGWLGLAAVGLSILSTQLRGRVGPVLAWSPAALVLAGLLPLLGSYLTTGHRLIEPFHVGWRAVAEQVEPEDVVFAERPEIAAYYLKRDDILPIPGVIEVIDERAHGQEAWLIRLSANSRGRRVWVPAENPRMRLIFRDATAVWLPRREVSVYRLTPLNPPAISTDLSDDDVH